MRMTVVLVLAGGALASAAPALPAETLVDSAKVFPNLEGYLKVPSAERDKFQLTYQVHTKGGGLEGVHMAYAEGGPRQPVALDRDGRLERLPTLAQAHGRIAVDKPEGVHLATHTGAVCTGLGGREIPTAKVRACLDQIGAATRRMAGVAAFAAPRFDHVALPGAAGGAVVMGDGSRRSLPAVGGATVFQPSAFEGARALVFDRAPARVEPMSPAG